MPLGSIARKLLGRRFQAVGEAYRAIFVDIGRIAEFWAGQIPENARVLEIGGGDGMVANALLRRRPDIQLTMVDVAAELGGFLTPEFRGRVSVRPRTSVSDIARERPRLEAIIIADVVHHIPADQRARFFAEVKELCDVADCRLLLVKDIQPGTLRGLLSYLSDRFVTGDRQVSLISQPELLRLILSHVPQAGIVTAVPDRANYCIVARL